MNRLSILFASSLLVGSLLGCGSSETPVAQGRAMGASPVDPASNQPATTTTPASNQVGLRSDADSRAGSMTQENQPPVLVGILIEPFGEVTVRNDITARPQAKDVDGDSIDFEYTWRVNGANAFIDEPVLPKANYRRGDWIELTVIASDGQATSQPLVSKPFEVTNAAPIITSVPGGVDANGVLEYQVRIEDPDDDDGFSYQIVDGPDGMQIDATSGLLSWRPSKRQTGNHSAQIEVTDPKGGKASQGFVLAMDLVSGAPPAAHQSN